LRAGSYEAFLAAFTSTVFAKVPPVFVPPVPEARSAYVYYKVHDLVHETIAKNV
jgi:hypothetical protein